MDAIDREYLEKIHEYLTDAIFKGKPYFIYDRYRFQIKDYEYASPVDMREFRRVGILPPPELEYAIKPTWVTYEVLRNMEMTESYGRMVACDRLAREFVYKMLPEIDRRIRILVSNEETERILSVLD
jgi:hypothetical protein